MFNKLLKRPVLVWCTILLLALFLRLYGLDLNPVGITHDDELHEIINAKSLAITGSGVPGVIAGVLTQSDYCIAGDCIYGELESYALIPWMWFFPLSIVFTKIPFVIGSLVLVFITGKLFENLSKNIKIGMIVGLLIAVNPWSIYFGRTAYPQLVSHLFYIVGAYFFTRHKSFKSNLIFGSLFSFLAFFFYFGAKPILPLIIIWGVVYNFYQFKLRPLRFTLLFAVAITVLIGGYFTILSNSYAGKRITEVQIDNPANVKELIDQQYVRLERFFGFFSPISLFLTGQKDTDNSYISSHGYYYVIDLPFLILGVFAIAKNYTNTLFTLSLLAIAVIPSTLKISETSIYSLRAALAYPILSGIIGWGFYYGWSKILAIKVKYKLAGKFFIDRVFLIIIIFFYTLSVAYFLGIYWYRVPKNQSTRWFFHERVLTNYITRIQNLGLKKIIVITARPDAIFNSFVFYSGIYEDKNKIQEINRDYLLQNFEYKGTKFIDDCKKITKEELADTIIFIDQVNPGKCDINQKNTPKIANPKDAGGIFNIVNESLCSTFPKNRYPQPKSIHDFKVEDLTDESFCRIWITNPD